MMADFVIPRHSAVMERLRRRIEAFRQRHNFCESRYEAATQERLELERQHTLNLHQRLLQSKAKRASKHRQPQQQQQQQQQPSAEQDGQRAPGGGAESGGSAAEQSRSSARAVLHDVVKRKMESGGSPLSNGLPDGLSSNKKACLDNGSTVDSKLGSNGTHRPAGEPADGGGGELDFQQKEMKQEPEDILPIMPPSAAGNNGLFLDLNLNEQEWKELMEELNCSVAIEDIQDILNYGFEDRKDPLEMTAAPPAGGAGGGPSSQTLLPDLSSVKAEFSPVPGVFEQDSRTGSPHVRSGSSGPPPHHTSSPVASSSASSPVLPPSQPGPPPRQLQPPPNHLLPPGPPPPKDLSPAQQLQQLAAQQRAQHIKMPPQPGPKFHGQGPHSHPPWTQMANSSQGSLGATFGMDKPTSPALYPSDFNPNAQKQLLMSAQPSKGSPKAGAGGYMSGPAGPPNMLSHLSSGPPLSHPPTQGAQTPAAILNYKNTIPLSHYEAGPAGPGPPRPPANQNQDKAALLNLLRQQNQQKNSMNFRHHLPHPQDQNNFSAPPHVTAPANSMTSGPGNNPMAAQGPNAMAGTHGNASFLRDQMVALKQQQQILEQQKKQQYMQRQLLAEQEKQRQQDQQLQRHLTRPPPQYQDQTGPAANQNPFPQQSVGQFTASSQPMTNIGSMGGSAPGSRMFPQNQGMMGMNMPQGGGPGGGVAPPTTASQADISLLSCVGGGGGASVDSLYNSMNLQRQSLGPMGAPYRQLQQQPLKQQQPNAAMLKQQQQLAAARMPNAMQGGMGGAMPGGQGGAWQQQLAGQPPSSNAPLHSNAFNNNNAFHMQQPRIPKMVASPASFSSGGRPMTQQMMQNNMASQQRTAPVAQQQQPAVQNQTVVSDLAAFGQPQGNGRQAMQCNQGYQVSRTAAQQQQQVSFGYNVAAGSFAAESDLVDSLLKSQSTQEWMADLDELLASHP